MRNDRIQRKAAEIQGQDPVRTLYELNIVKRIERTEGPVDCASIQHFDEREKDDAYATYHRAIEAFSDEVDAGLATVKTPADNVVRGKPRMLMVDLRQGKGRVAPDGSFEWINKPETIGVVIDEEQNPKIRKPGMREFWDA